MKVNDTYKLSSLDDPKRKAFERKRNYLLDSNRPIYYVNESGLRIDALTGNILKEEDYVKRP